MDVVVYLGEFEVSDIVIEVLMEDCLRVVCKFFWFYLSILFKVVEE